MQISDTAAVKTGLACSKTNTVLLQFQYGETAICRWQKVVSKIKRRMARKGKYCRFLEARGVERTLSDGAVEQYPRRATPTYQYFHRSDLHALEIKRQAKRSCLGTEEAAEDDGCSSSARRITYVGDESSTDSSNESDSDSSSSGEDVNAQSCFGNGQVRSMTYVLLIHFVA